MTKTPEEMAEELDDQIERQSILCVSLLAMNDGEYFAAKKAYKAGYQAAKDQLADADKVMNSPEKQDSCEHILDMEKMVDVNSSNNLNGWISVKDRLPEVDQVILIWTKSDKIHMVRIYKNEKSWSNSCGCCGGNEDFTQWMPLPKPPEDK